VKLVLVAAVHDGTDEAAVDDGTDVGDTYKPDTLRGAGLDEVGARVNQL